MASPVYEHKKDTKKKINFSIILISDTRYNEFKEGKASSDKSLGLIQKILEENNHKIIKYIIIPDEISKISAAVNELLANDSIDMIITTGGTGISPRDVTVEAIMPLLDKKIEGFGEIFRYLSYIEIGSAAMLSRAFAGVIKQKIIYCLPGSPNACKLALEKLILKESGHALKMIGKKREN
ncbi:MAG: MogA/MoaB family molybdenum cofactor biosynthesis protein [Candidatus Lokiarchaeota archaeon]|nr:MogA/MoaB family molybdenum cofactor biosynthesis protein [Candidatus Lokiarchaeota archaeon]